MTSSKTLAIAFGVARGAFGAGLIAAPSKVASGWLEQDAARPRAQVAIRGLGGRDIAISAGTVAAALDGAPVRPWLLASVGSDIADIAATFAAGRSLGDRARYGTLALAGLSIAAGAWLALASGQ
jgi:hypothetical protein